MNNIGHWSSTPKWFHVCVQSQFISAKGQHHPPLAHRESYADPNSPDEGLDDYEGVSLKF